MLQLLSCTWSIRLAATAPVASPSLATTAQDPFHDGLSMETCDSQETVWVNEARKDTAGVCHHRKACRETASDPTRTHYLAPFKSFALALDGSTTNLWTTSESVTLLCRKLRLTSARSCEAIHRTGRNGCEMQCDVACRMPGVPLWPVPRESEANEMSVQTVLSAYLHSDRTSAGFNLRSTMVRLGSPVHLTAF